MTCEQCQEQAVYQDADSDEPIYFCSEHAAELALDWMVQTEHFIPVNTE